MWMTRMIAFLTASLQRKLILALMAIATAVMGMGGIYLSSNQQQSASVGLEARAAYMASMLSKTLAEPLWNIELKSIQDQLETVMSDPEIYSVALYEGEKKEPLVSKKRDGLVVDRIEREASVIYARDPSQPPVNLGKLRIVYTRSSMVQTLRKTRMMILAGVLLLLFFLFAATYILLRRMVQKPVGDLLATVHRIADGDLEVRIPVSSRDEIGLLSENFNVMTDKLKQTMDGLNRSEQNYRSINETLEARIRERTEKLHDQVAESAKTRKAMLNILEDLEVSRKETESTMHKINAMSQAVNDALVMIDGRGNVLFWNQAAEKLFGYTAAEAMGKDFHEMAVPSETREKARGGMNQFAATGQGAVFGSTIETVAINRQGLSFPVEVSLSPFQVNGKWFAVGTVRDITERKATEESLRQAGNEQIAIFESLTLGIAFIKDRIILRGNTKLGELFGRPLDEMIGQSTSIWYKNEEEYLGIGASTYEDLKRQDIHQREQQLPRKDGSLFWCLFRVRAVDVHDISQGIVCTLEDITERKQAEKELKERMEELERFSRLTINREEKMIQLKEEINTLLEQMGKEKKYKIVE